MTQESWLRGLAVYAPGASCFSLQALEGLGARAVWAYRFRYPLELYAESAAVLADIFSGDTRRVASLFEDSIGFAAAHGAGVVYDVLLVESRWFEAGILPTDEAGWDDLRNRLMPHRQTRVVVLDIGYPHVGHISQIGQAGRIRRDDVEQFRSVTSAKCRLLSILSEFECAYYFDAASLMAHRGYSRSATNMLEHSTAEGRALVQEYLARGATTSADERRSEVMRAVAMAKTGAATVWLDGARPTEVAPGDPLLRLRVVVTSDDPLQCPLEFRVVWTSDTHATLDWSVFSVGEDGRWGWHAPITVPGNLDATDRFLATATTNRLSVRIIE